MADTSPLVTQAEKSLTIFDLRGYSFQMLLRVTALVSRFTNNCRHSDKWVGKLSAAELINAKTIWMRFVQRKHFPEILESNGSLLGKLKPLGPVEIGSDGLIRCLGRFENSSLADSATKPILLPKEEPFVDLLIRHCHEELNHAGVKHVLAELRCEYWIPKGRLQVKRVLAQCLSCKRRKGGPFKVPLPPPLPWFRVTEQRPFSSVGLDYLGPLQISTENGNVQKIWICLYTCAVTRAIHLEVVPQMNSEQFLLCFRRFMSFYGSPTLVVSDNASQFHTSKRVMDKLWHQTCHGDVVQEFASSKAIHWKFITEAAPWMGGFYERLVGVVKSSLKAAVDRRRLTMIELQTVVYETAGIVNSRPLTYLEEEVGDAALTPAHLLMRHRTIYPFLYDEDEDISNPPSTRQVLIAGWKRIQNLLDCFWKSWRTAYLLALRQHFRVAKQRNVSDCVPRVGEVVLIEEDLQPRSLWKLGRITALIPSADGQIRSVKLILPNKHSITRPIKLLYPLEISGGGGYDNFGLGRAVPDRVPESKTSEVSVDVPHIVEESELIDTAPDLEPARIRPKRKAAVRAGKMIEAQLRED
jgi:hypothetical protein